MKFSGYTVGLFMVVKTRVIASLRGRKDKPAKKTILACVNERCHPGTIKQGQDGDNSKCVVCKRALKSIFEVSAGKNERVTVSVQNMGDGLSLIYLTRHSLSINRKKRHKFLFHKGKLQLL